MLMYQLRTTDSFNQTKKMLLIFETCHQMCIRICNSSNKTKYTAFVISMALNMSEMCGARF